VIPEALAADAERRDDADSRNDDARRAAGGMDVNSNRDGSARVRPARRRLFVLALRLLRLELRGPSWAVGGATDGTALAIRRPRCWTLFALHHSPVCAAMRVKDAIAR
jgi:hypothetical protein